MSENEWRGRGRPKGKTDKKKLEAIKAPRLPVKADVLFACDSILYAVCHDAYYIRRQVHKRGTKEGLTEDERKALWTNARTLEKVDLIIRANKRDGLLEQISDEDLVAAVRAIRANHSNPIK